MKKSGILLCIAVFILVIGTGIVAPLLAPYANNIGASSIWIGLLFSGFYIVRLIVGTPIGWLADKQGPKSVLVYSLLLYPFIALAYWSAGSTETLLFARLLHGLASAMMLPMAMAYIGEISPHGQEGRYMGVYNTFLFIAGGIGPIAGGFLADQFGTSNAFLSLFILAVPSLGIALLLPSVGKSSTKEVKSKEKIHPPRSKRRFWKHPGLMSLAAMNVVFAVLNVFLVSFFTLFAQSKGLSLLAVGFLIALNSIAIGAIQVPLGRLADRFDKYKLVLVSGITTIIILMIFPLAQSFITIAVLMVLVGITSAITLAATSALSTILGRDTGMGGVMGFLGSATSLGMVIGPMASGWLVYRFNIASTFYFSGAIWLLGIGFFAVFWIIYQRSLVNYDEQSINNSNHTNEGANI